MNKNIAISLIMLLSISLSTYAMEKNTFVIGFDVDGYQNMDAKEKKQTEDLMYDQFFVCIKRNDPNAELIQKSSYAMPNKDISFEISSTQLSIDDLEDIYNNFATRVFGPKKESARIGGMPKGRYRKGIYVPSESKR